MTTAAPKAAPRLTDDELHVAEVQVLHPETHSDGKGIIRIGEHEFELRPLNVKYERQLAAIVNPVFANFQKAIKNAGSDNLDFSIMGEFQDAFTGIVHELAKMYGKHIPKEEIEDKLGSDEIRDIIERQLELSRKNLFLLVNLRNLLTTAAQSVRHTNRIAQVADDLVSQQLALPTSASASPGESPSTSS